MGYVPVEGEGEETEPASQSHSGPGAFPRWAEERAWWAFPGSGERDGSGLLLRVSWDPRGGVRAGVSASGGADCSRRTQLDPLKWT